ncbi:hypothetical protein FHG87_022344 [Trinorchestia longiramus]|nr:hypothetical protein FHG87_022344 [Trinorchestia longiramus]
MGLNYKRVNFELLKEELSSLDYEVLMRNKNDEKCFIILKEKFATATEHHIPTMQLGPITNPSWFLHEIKRLINARKQSYRKRNKRCQTELDRQQHISTYQVVKDRLPVRGRRNRQFSERHHEDLIAK